MRGKTGFFVQCDECCDDKLLHCTVASEQANVLKVMNESQFHQKKVEETQPKMASDPKSSWVSKYLGMSENVEPLSEQLITTLFRIAYSRQLR